MEGDDYWQDNYLGAARRGFFQRVGDAVKKVGSGIKNAATMPMKILSHIHRLGFIVFTCLENTQKIIRQNYSRKKS